MTLLLNFERSITAVADAGGGDITVTTSAQHPLYAGDTVTYFRYYQL